MDCHDIVPPGWHPLRDPLPPDAMEKLIRANTEHREAMWSAIVDEAYAENDARDQARAATLEAGR
jgi:hypothetical protein